MCCQLRGFAELAEMTSPEELMGTLLEYNAVLSDVIGRGEGSVGHVSGDQVMVFFNDPLPVDDPAGDAVRLAVELRAALAEAIVQWRRRGFELGFAQVLTSVSPRSERSPSPAAPSTERSVRSCTPRPDCWPRPSPDRS